QEEAIACRQTILLETGVGHATRCADTAFGKHFADVRRRLIQEGRTKEEIRETLEMLNLGRLRIASKGIIRGDTDPRYQGSGTYQQVDDRTQRRDGMYMIGQVAALRERMTTIGQLHEEVSRGGVEQLGAFLPEMREGVGTSSSNGPCDVAIIGMSCLLPQAPNLRRFWDNIVNKVNTIVEIPPERWDSEPYFDSDRRAPDKIYSKWGGFIDDVPFDPLRYGMPPNTLPSIEPMHLMVLEAVRHALDDAGYSDRPFDREHTSVILGAGGGVADLGLGYGFRSLLPYYMRQAGVEDGEAEALIERLDGTLPEWTEDSFAGLLLNVAAGRVANRFDLGGTNFTVDAACASSLAAVRLGVNELETGSSNLVIVGGADTMQSPFAYLCFSKTQALSPTGQCRTFDEAGDGIVISEGIAIAVLKRLEDARRDGDRIYAIIKGVGSSSDGKDKGLTAPRPAGQISAMQRAYAKAGVSPDTVSLVEAHGTGTVVGDQSEVEALTAMFSQAGASKQGCALGSVKSMIGHTKCTAGLVGLLKAALALHHKVLPPTLGVVQPNAKANFKESPFHVNTETRPWLARADGVPRRAGVSAFGFGGTNFHAVLEEHVAEVERGEAVPGMQTWPAELFLWRASSTDELVQSIDRVTDALAQGAQPLLRDLAAAVCRTHGRAKGAHCLAVVATSIEDLVAKLSDAKATLNRGDTEIHDPRGVYYSGQRLTPPGRIAFVFPGQGSQTVNMLRDLSVVFSEVREVFEKADCALGETLGRPLSALIFPPPCFNDEDRAADQAALTETRVAQPAIGAADLAMLKLLSGLGIRAELMCGHSYGEYVALCAAGALTEEELLRVSEARGRLISEAARDKPGTMAAVQADEAAVEPIVASIDGVAIANLNAPNQTVISGTQAGVEEALRRLSQQGVIGKRIAVSCAFHSPLVADAQEPFRKVLEGVAWKAPRVGVYSNTTASLHETDPTAIRKQLAEHLLKPVRFVDEIQAMYDAGARVFVEVGPGKTLTTLIERILKGRTFTAVATARPGRSGLVQWIHALAQLAAAGVPVQGERLFAGRTQQRLDLNKLVEQSKPVPLSPTTWMVNGTRAVPLNGKPNRPSLLTRSDRS
ncbi:MAG: acyltransferase domain-containing protein, partial [Planctomycetes bacterium]|nr:acyltransferase domain-containing protein [Planctomycetota bacterium]